MAGTKRCPKCDGAMTQGVTLIKNKDRQHIGEWMEGVAVKRWYGIQLPRNQRSAVETWRCNRCNYLENYAPPPNN